MKSALNPALTTQAVPSKARRVTFRILLGIAALLVIALLTWQGLTANGNPDPTLPNTSAASGILDIAVLVFREGLECILVLSAIMANMSGAKQPYRKPIAQGAMAGFIATVVTWFVAVGILSDLSNNVSALALQAATGLLAVVVLLIVMNWFFHKLYWGGWISLHNRKKREFISEANETSGSRAKMLWGLALVGFTSFYREGFEVVLFLQGYRLKLGTAMVLAGLAVGLFFTAIVAVLNFIAHRKLPYRKMLVLTGIMLGMVLLVMVGEQVQEMQQANWIGTHDIAWLAPHVPDWAGLWFGLFPNVEGLIGQGIALVLVGGSYFLYRGLSRADEELVDSATKN
ncbi:MAG TPA: FTR1 family protein [Opitutales bacterium]|jgi:high-affinity iron transporter|nr:FTR1 family protein [Opitutales bacterium]